MIHESPATRRRRILVVDDDRPTRLLLRDFLEGEGFEVTQARDGIEGLRSARTAPPDLVVTDLRMPGLDGHGFVARLEACAPGVPVVLMSSEDPSSGRAQRRIPFLRKPLDLDALSGMLARAGLFSESGGATRRSSRAGRLGTSRH
ncbi:MAG TPA: response regulator [Polyangiaceae bacterium]|nr:response regulator [Polyangiaceae bacterium]